jgi:hypothetical protein
MMMFGETDNSLPELFLRGFAIKYPKKRRRFQKKVRYLHTDYLIEEIWNFPPNRLRHL